MDFGSTGLQSILKSSVQHKNVKLIMTVNKAEEIINIITSTFRDDPYKKIIIGPQKDVIITSETTKILNSIKLVHPIQFLLRDILSKMSKQGDGNTFLVILVGKILNKCKELLFQGLKAPRIVESLKMIKKIIFERMEKLKEKKNIDFQDVLFLTQILQPVLKNDTLVLLLTDAIKKSSFTNPDDIRIQKIYSGNLDDSFVIHGMIIENTLDVSIKECKGRTAIFNTSLDIERTETKGTLLIEKAEEMLAFGKDEDKHIESLVNSISENVDAIFCNGNVNEQYVEFFNSKHVMVIKIISKFDLRRIMRMTNSKLLQTVRKPQMEETGKIDHIKTIYHGNRPFLQMEKSDSNVVTIVLKDCIKSNLDEYEILLEKGIKVLNNIAETDLYLLNGGGILEKELSENLDLESLQINDSKKLVFDSISKILKEFAFINSDEKKFKDAFSTKKIAYESAFDIACEVMMIEDYLVAKNENMQQN